MNTMLSSATELELRVRKYIESKVSAPMLYAFEMAEGMDLSLNAAGDLFEQNNDFWLFELDIDTVRRAGPGINSPRRYWGTLSLALFTQEPRDKVRYGSELEAVADWFQDMTVEGIRFRSFVPTPAVPIRGFTSYNGVINFEFEINITR